MIKRWLSSGILLLALSVLIAAYVLIVSNLPGEVYTPDLQRALIVHSRLNLTQAAPLWNVYTWGEAADALAPGATLGAVDCRVHATLDARYEEVEGVTTTAYDLDFDGTYRLRYAGPAPTTTLELIFPFPEGLDTLNRVYFLVDGAEPPDAQYSLGGITWRTEVGAGEEREVVVRYCARGVGSFRYALDHNRRLENLDVEIVVQGLPGSEVPGSSLPTTAVENDGEGERFAWHYDALIADHDIQVTLPERPGFVQRVERLREPLRRLSLVSPLLVVFFVACLAGMHRLSGVRLPFQHYLLVGIGFFLFYPALTFLCGALDLAPAAAVALAAVTTLLFAFMRRVAGWRRTWWQTLLLVAIFLGLFSLGTMSRWRGLLLTTGGLLLVGTFMQLIAQQWLQRPPEIEATEETEPAPQEGPEVESEPGAGVVPATTSPEPTTPPPPSRHCPHCGAPLDETFAFCPACGRNARLFRRCPACGSEHYVPPEADLSHCPTCGNPLNEQTQ
jgi:hypothetical protein